MVKDRAPEEVFYRVQIIDAEGGKIRFGPFTVDDIAELHPGVTAEDLPGSIVTNLQQNIQSLGLEQALTFLGIWGGFRVFLKGDDGTDIGIWEVDAP